MVMERITWIKRGARGRWTASAALFLGVIGLIAVSSDQAAGASTTTTLPATYGLTEPTSLGGNFPLTKVPPKNEHVCYINDGNPLSTLNQQGEQAAAKLLGWKLTVIQANFEEPSSYAAGITSSEQAGCNAAVENGAIYANYKSAIPSAISAHMIIEDANTSNKVGKGVIQVLPSSQVEGAEGIVEANATWADIKKNYPKGKVLIQQATIPQYQSTFAPQLATYASTMKRFCGSRCSIYTVSVDITVANGASPSAPFIAALQKNPSTKYMIQNALTDHGVAAAVKQAGLTVPRIIGNVPLQAQLADLSSPNPTSVGWVAPFLVANGWYEIDALARYFTAAKNTYPWISVPFPLWFVMPTNVHVYESQDGAYPVGYQKLWGQMWKVKSS